MGSRAYPETTIHRAGEGRSGSRRLELGWGERAVVAMKGRSAGLREGGGWPVERLSGCDPGGKLNPLRRPQRRANSLIYR